MKVITTLYISFLVLVSVNQVSAYSITEKVGDNAFCKIAKVDDGDTFDLDCTTKYYPNVRLLWVNTPDKDQKTGKKSCYYDEAKSLLENRKDRLYKVEFYGSDICKDPYKWCRNLVRLIDVEKDFDLGERMIERGFAFSWTNFSMVPESLDIAYNRSEKIAYSKWRWIWSDCEVEFFNKSVIDSSHPNKMTK